jgi:hypothetical protein
VNQPSVQKAIDLLVRLQAKTTPSTLAYWVTPNTVLTLCGARAYCDGVFYGPKAELKNWRQEVDNSIDVIKSLTDVYFADTKMHRNQFGDYVWYELVLSEGIGYISNQSVLLTQAQLTQILNLAKPDLLQPTLRRLLKANPKLSAYNTSHLDHLGFGIMLGYPDKAILASVTYWQADDPEADKLVDANITGADFYNCPQPIYAYPRSLIDDPTIRAHEQLWSKLLKDFYASDFHKALAKNPDFHIKAKRLGLLD